jgi:hypothetical protein
MYMNTNKKISLDLKEDEVNMLIEALLFSSSVNVGANWNESTLTKMFNLSKKIKKSIEAPKLEHIVFYKEDNYEDKLTPNIVEQYGDSLKMIELQNA